MTTDDSGRRPSTSPMWNGCGCVCWECLRYAHKTHTVCIYSCALRTRTTDSPCTCGSGGHPRECAAHPLARELHCAEISLSNVTEERDEWRTTAQGLRVQVSRISGILLDLEPGSFVSAAEALDDIAEVIHGQNSTPTETES